MKTSGAEIITRCLERFGVRTVAGIPGGSVLPLYDALRTSSVRHVLARHEQGAGFIAQGMARATGRAGVCIATSGPGATNLVTAIADAYLDSIPMVAITGQVSSNLIGTSAFQEVDVLRMTAAITKARFGVRRASELLEIMRQAFAIAEGGRPGPVLIDVPKDVLVQELEIEDWPEPPVRQPLPAPTTEQLDAMARAIAGAERPVIFVGGGVIASGAAQALRALVDLQPMPIATSLQGIGAIPSDHPCHLGMLGMHGSKGTNRALEEADLLIALGVRFDDRATGKVEEFCQHASIIHVDVDPTEIGRLKPANLGIAADVRSVLERLLSRLPKRQRMDWRTRVSWLSAQHSMPIPSAPDSAVQIIRSLSQLIPRDAIITTDVGQHQMWVAQHYPFREPRTWVSSGGLGTMGFGLPAAIGVALACPERKVVCISGDGSILMNIQELATLAELELNVTVIVLNNQHLGLVRQQQRLFYGERYHASAFSRSPDFAAIAEGLGIIGVNAGKSALLTRTLEAALALPGPALVEVPISPDEVVLPMVPPGAANSVSIEGVERTAPLRVRAV